MRRCFATYLPLPRDEGDCVIEQSRCGETDGIIGQHKSRWIDRTWCIGNLPAQRAAEMAVVNVYEERAAAR